MTLSCQWSTVSLYRTLYRIPVSYPCIVSYPFCMYRILVFYPCIVFVLYEYVLRSHRIVGYQYTYKIQKIYNFSGIQLNTHLRIQSGIFEHEYTSRIRRIKHVFLNTIGYKQDTNPHHTRCSHPHPGCETLTVPVVQVQPSWGYPRCRCSKVQAFSGTCGAGTVRYRARQIPPVLGALRYGVP